MLRRRWMMFAFAALLALAVAAPVASACPGCKDALPSEQNTAGLADNPSGASSPRLAEGFYYSILLMLGMPVVLLGGGSFAIYRAIKQGNARHAALAARRAAGSPADPA